MLQVYTIKPNSTINTNVTVLNAILVNVTSFLVKKTGNYDQCPDFMLQVNWTNQIIFNNMTNGLCYIPVTFAGTLSAGQQLSLAGTLSGYQTISNMITLTNDNIKDIQSGTGLQYNINTNPVTGNLLWIIAVVVGAVVLIIIIVIIFVCCKKGGKGKSKDTPMKIAAENTATYH